MTDVTRGCNLPPWPSRGFAGRPLRIGELRFGNFRFMGLRFGAAGVFHRRKFQCFKESPSHLLHLHIRFTSANWMFSTEHRHCGAEAAFDC